MNFCFNFKENLNTLKICLLEASFFLARKLKLVIRKIFIIVFVHPKITKLNICKFQLCFDLQIKFINQDIHAPQNSQLIYGFHETTLSICIAFPSQSIFICDMSTEVKNSKFYSQHFLCFLYKRAKHWYRYQLSERLCALRVFLRHFVQKYSWLHFY